MSVGAIDDRPSARMPWDPQSPIRASAFPSTTPAGYPRRTPSGGGSKTPIPSLSPQPRGLQASSPNYFESQTTSDENYSDSKARLHSKTIWGTPRTGDGAGGAENSSQRHLDASGSQSTDGSLRHFSASRQPSTRQYAPQTEGAMNNAETSMNFSTSAQGPSFFTRPQMASPAGSEVGFTKTDPLKSDERSKSLPHARPASSTNPISKRAETLPACSQNYQPAMISPQNLRRILEEQSTNSFLLLDLRVSKQYATSRVTGSSNLNLPTTLLKRPSYNVHKLAQCLGNNEVEREKFARWSETAAIIVYDQASTTLHEASSCVHILKKFSSEGYQGALYILTGGFQAFSESCPDQVESGSINKLDGSSLTISPPAAAPIAGGCHMPDNPNAVPFFSTIRQNLELANGVGRQAIELPSNCKDDDMAGLPFWLRQVTRNNDEGKLVAEKFFAIEKAEQERMQKALTVSKAPDAHSPNGLQFAGFELGISNRYKDILPFNHSRVVLKREGNDYINASHLKSQFSARHYIATQAPVPATFADFWHLVWDQNARLIVMLTAETEGGLRKGDNYWSAASHGPFTLTMLSERKVSLEFDKPNRSFISPHDLAVKDRRPSIGKRRSTNHGTGLSPHPSKVDPEAPSVIIRKLTLAHNDPSSEAAREITQIHYSHWPDFSIARPSQILGLIKQAEPLGGNEAPIVVHCSAGCGRTGVFCVVDTVLDILKRQKAFRRKSEEHHGMPETMDVDNSVEDAWLAKDDTDFVAKTVADFRLQRLSMVQTLQQFVLCYESVLEWLLGGVKTAVIGEERKSWAG